MLDPRDRPRRATNQTNITVGLVANLFAGAALVIAHTFGWAHIAWGPLTVAMVIGATSFGVFTTINLTRRKPYDDAFMDVFFWGAMVSQLPVYALGTLSADNVRPVTLLMSMVLLAMLFLRATLAQALAYGISLAALFVGASALAPVVLGANQRFWIDLYFLAIWMPSLGMMAVLAGQQHAIRHRLTARREAIATLSNQRVEFFRQVSHAIRNPLTMILGPLEHLRRTDPDSRWLEVAQANARRMAHQLNALLRHEALAARLGSSSLQGLDLSSFIQQFVARYYGVPAARGVRVKAHGAQAAFGLADPEKLEEVLVNYVTNAIKYSPDKGVVDVSVRTTPTGPRIVVSDQGPGISHADKPKLFQPFATLGDATSRRSGTGIGLHTVRRLAGEMGANVGVDSREGFGSHFYITLTRAEAPSGPAQVEYLEPTVILTDAQFDPDGPTIDRPSVLPDAYVLVVEDDLDLRNFVADLLEGEGFTVCRAKNGEEAWVYIQMRTPELIVTDWMMDGLNGPDLIRRVREDPEHRSVPIILLTARSDPESRTAGTKVGADAFIGKPFEQGELLSTVTNLLRLKEREGEVRELNRQLREELFGRFLPPALVNAVVEGRASFDDAPQMRQITTLVVDIVGFTALTERLRAGGIAAYLSDYFRLVSDVVFEHEGFLDKFLGDGVLVHFGVPVQVPIEQQVKRAAACAEALHQRTGELDAIWQVRCQGKTRLRVGIHHGPAAVGYLGTDRRTEYTAVGPSVNLAFGIHAVCRPGCTFVSGVIADVLGRPDDVVQIGPFDVKGVGALPLFQLGQDRTPAAGSPSELANGERFGPYRVCGLIGQGAMAMVYEVLHETLDRPNALKVLLDAKPDLATRLVEEGKIQSRLMSPHIVPVLDVIDIHGKHGLVMPLVDGCSLEDLLTRYEVTPHEASAVALAVGRGLAAAHKGSIVHRDLKPANVLLDTSTGDVVPRVADFGLARDRRRAVTETLPGQFIGTPIYASPEQYTDPTRVGPAADVWGLGAILYELLAGRSPFINGPVWLIREQVEAADYDEDRLPEPWRPLVGRMLCVDPDQRPTAEVVCTELEKVVPDPDPLAHPRFVATVRNDEPTELF
ncbi:MAG: response regulator [Myxococcota bacterium]